MAIRIARNKSQQRRRVYGEAEHAAFDPVAAARVRLALQSWPTYARTPLLELSGLARELHLGHVWAKDETKRAPLYSFKYLGGPYALAESILDRFEQAHGNRPDQSALWSGKLRHEAERLHVHAATDGNHGRAVAWAASCFGCRCTIYLPSNVSPGREGAIAQFNPRIVHVVGTWDDAMRIAAEEAKQTDGLLIQDTSFPGYTENCQRIMYGYSTMVDEALADLPDSSQPPTHLFLQTGCGGLAASVVAEVWSRYQANRPTVVVVQAKKADAVLRSVESGTMQTVGGDHATVMVGIACGEVSLLAWSILRDSADFVVAIDDAPAVQMMKVCAQGMHGDAALEVGETGVAGLAALSEVMRDRSLAEEMGLGPESRVLVFLTEGVIDRMSYQRALNGMAKLR